MHQSLLIAALFPFACGGSVVGGVPEGSQDASGAEVSGPDAGDAADSDMEGGAPDIVDAADPPDVAPDLPSDVPVEPEPAEPDDLFALGPPVQVQISLDEAAYLGLQEEPFQDVPASLVIDGWTVEVPLTVRLGGRFGGQRTIDEKPSFEIAFDGSVAGLTHLVLNNNVMNRAQMRAQLSYAMARDFEVPAPRATWAWVTVNGATYGLYGLEESLEDPGFSVRWFGDTSGPVYRVGNSATDVVPDQVAGISKVVGDPADTSDLDALAAALASIESDSADEDIFEALALHLDVAAYVNFAALEIFVAHTQGYAMGPRNYALHRGGDGLWRFIASNMERSFRGITTPWIGRGIVQRLCLRSLQCRKAYGERLQAVVDRAAVNGILAVALSARQVVLGAIEADPKLEANPNQIEGAVNQTINRLVGWSEALPFNLACADPPSVDRDGDGFSGCTDDCDDDDPTVNPGQPELCNLKDDNCSGAIDDADGCEPCVPLVGADGISYEFCFEPRTWVDARDYCISRGGDLASIHSASMQVEIKDAAFDVLFQHWWVGLNDRDEEGVWTWTDGSPLDFEAWNDGEPNDSGGEDCGHLSTWGDGGWNDIPCSDAFPQVCQLPADTGGP